MRGDNILKLFEKVFGTHSDREMKKIRRMVDISQKMVYNVYKG